MTILCCNCDNEKACTMHADELYQSEETEMNKHVATPFRNILNQMLEDAQTDKPLAAAVRELYGDDYIAARIREPSIPVTLDGLKDMMMEAGIRSYCDQCDMWRDGNGCKFC